MAYVSIQWGKSAAQELKYVLKERGDQDVTDSSGCSIENAATDFESVRNEHGKNGGNQALHIVQSFSPKDSQKLSPEEFNSMGRALAEENFPGHQYVVRTHTDREHTHNHIVLNTVNAETGRKIENKRALIEQLRRSSDKTCLEHGLSVINQEAHERQARLPRKVQQMVRAGKKSYIYDLVQKADVARSIATSFDEYRDTLSGFGVRTLIEEKNISYFYPGKERGKRGSKLGRDYDKSGLVEAFRVNDERFAKNPALKAQLIGQGEQIQKYGMPKTPEGLSHFTKLWDGKDTAWRDYTAHTKVTRRQSDLSSRSERDLLSKFVPAEEIRRAKSQSIPDYCKRNKIELTTNERGQTIFAKKPFVVLTSETEFKNGKNGTQGSLIDIVAAHKNCPLLQAVSRINGNARLLLLEQHMGEVKHSYRSFYIPRADRAKSQTGSEKLASLLRSFGANQNAGSKLQEKGLAQVHQNGSIWLFPKDKPSSALEFIEGANRTWTKKVHGKPTSPFHSDAGTGAKAILFLEPESALKHFGLELFESTKRKSGVLVLMEPSERLVDQYVAANRHVRSISFVSSHPSQPSKAELDFFSNLKRRYLSFGISVEQASPEKSKQLMLEGRTKGFDLGL